VNSVYQHPIDEHLLITSGMSANGVIIYIYTHIHIYTLTLTLTLILKVNSVQQHPIDEHLLITSGMSANGVISIHDLRKAGPSWSAVKTLDEHTKSINAAYCSPDGEFIVSVGQDSTIRTWKNFIHPDEEIQWTATRHDNYTGRWLSTLKPAFDPKAPATFVLGIVRKNTCSYPDMSDTHVMLFCMRFHCFVHRFCFVVFNQF
jgi:WD40 repeat protein